MVPSVILAVERVLWGLGGLVVVIPVVVVSFYSHH
jgi:hypothetical protein